MIGISGSDDEGPDGLLSLFGESYDVSKPGIVRMGFVQPRR